MYGEKEVFERIKEFLASRDKDIESAYKIHRKIISILPRSYKEKYYFRYLELGVKI